MHARFVALAALTLFNMATAPAFAAGPDFNYLQNELDGRGRCLGARGDTVAMMSCDKSPDQQWVLGKGSVPSYGTLHTMAGGAGACLAVHRTSAATCWRWRAAAGPTTSSGTSSACATCSA